MFNESTAGGSLCWIRRLAVLMVVAIGVFVTTVQADEIKPVVRVGSKAFTESVILGEVIRHLGRHSGVNIVHLAELGGTQVCWKALLAGEIDVYVEYTGTIQKEILDGETVRDEETMRRLLNLSQITMSRPLGFNNTYALGITEEVAQRLEVRTLSELARHSGMKSLKLRFSDEFLERDDGWRGLANNYGFDPEAARGIDHALAYRGLQAGSHHVTDVFTTDAEIRFYNVRVLEDDLGYFPVYQAVLLYRDDLEAKAPRFVESLRRLEGPSITPR